MSYNRTPRRKKVRKLNPVRLALVAVALALLIAAGSVLGIVIYSTRDMPAWDPTALQPNLSSYIYDKDEHEVANIYVENRVPIEFEKIPDSVKSAFLAIEDIRFYNHNGLDLRRILGALLADIKTGEATQGGSTITQQLVKRAFLTPEKKVKRKIQEAALAIQLERKFTKDQIFEMYLNRIYFGQGAYGIQSAAQVYFGRDAENLELEEAALLAALPKAPNSYDPYKNMEAATKRRNLVLDSMVKNGYISKVQAEAAKAKEITLNGTKAKALETYKYPYFVDYITDVLIAKYGEDKVYKGGLKVYTTLDPSIQEHVEKVLADPKNFPKAKYDDKGIIQPQAAVVVLDPQTGHIKAIAGGRDHKQKRQFNRAMDAVRQPGSAFKPIAVYGPAIEKGKSPTAVVDDSPAIFGSHEFKNYDEKYHGLVTYRTAITHSYNVSAVKVLNETGVAKANSFARKLGITTLVSAEENRKYNDENLSFGLGGLTRGVKPVELAAAYGTFANKGIYVQPVAITVIKDREGHIIDQFKPKKTIAMKNTTAYLMTSMLRSVMTSGTGTGASLGNRPAAGKTGTTSDYKDAWFVGYTPELVTAVWMGHDDPKPMKGITGGSYPARIWRNIMNHALKSVPVTDFERPPGIVEDTVCSKSGKKPGDLCPQEDLVTDIFAKGTVPTEVCDVHTLIKVCADSGQLPTANCPNVVSKAFPKGEEPKEACTLHPGPANFHGIPVCTDPAHGGILYRALIPGPGEEGGCPSEKIEYREFPEGQEPTATCPIPQHQLGPQNPANPASPQSPGSPGSPQVKLPQANEPKWPRSLWNGRIH